MGVIPCDRGNCPNIMCDLYVRDGDRSYRICSRCYSELRGVLQESEERSRGGLLGEVTQFMRTDPEHDRTEIEDVDSFLAHITERRE